MSNAAQCFVKKSKVTFLLIFPLLCQLIFQPLLVVAATTEFTTVGANVPTDIDGDGMPNDWELLYGLDPADPVDAGFDLDSDGLVNLEEYNRTTDPTNDDTDGGGLKDGDEISQGKDPLDPSDDGVPIISNIMVSNITETSALITWATNELADSEVGYSVIPGVYSNTVDNATLVTSHSINLSGLLRGTTYYFSVSSEDGTGGEATSVNDTVQTFTTLDLTPPSISNINAIPIITSATITWLTSENATSQIEYGLTSSLGTFSAKDLSLSSAHNVTVNGLLPETTYYYRVISEDALSNESSSSINTFITGVEPSDTIPPVISEVLIVESSPGVAKILFTTDEDSRGYVAFGSTESLELGNTSGELTALGTSHEIILNEGFLPGEKYYFKVYALDGEGNIGASSIVSLVFASAGDEADEVVDVSEAIPQSIQNRFGIYDPNGDDDSDSLTNAEEVFYGTNPQDADTDGDGLGDFAEIFRYKTDPNRRDTDSDGLLDLEEILDHKTDPLVWDTDNGGVSDGDEVASATNPLNPNDDVYIGIRVYLGDEENDYLGIEEGGNVELPEGMELSLSLDIPYAVSGVLIEYGDTTFFTEEGSRDFKLRSPGGPGVYLLKIQVLSPDGDVVQVSRYVEVKKRGQIRVEYDGYFKPWYKFIPFLRDRVIQGASVSLYFMDDRAEEWVVVDQSMFDLGNPQSTSVKGEYVFLAQSGDYRVVVEAREGTIEDYFDQDKGTVVNQDYVYELNGDWVIVLILLAVFIISVFFLYYLVVSRRRAFS